MNSTDVRRRWADRSGAYSPEYYAYYGPNETSQVLREVLERRVGRTASVLELGCSSGRHLAHLHDHGFENLAGIDLNSQSFAVMADAYPDLAAAGEFSEAAIEDVVEDFETDRFDAVYSVETLQHLHPDAEWVFDELARIVADTLVTAEIEREPGESNADRERADETDVSYVDDEFPLYYRDWNAVFTDRGFVEVDATATRRDRVRTFRRADSSDAR
ncbi:class I SAM-dependent methyltransferase [Halopiger goleimassiliensis]|uniref:class I SAM-dependent methyltransferase n=1 Tax=Halopiger goleimassiliensis TaxID=1293048 RepID=UPI0006777B71|nr:class I SAM-dependent methyltransferase [Halopiger goleimassiliensis]